MTLREFFLFLFAVLLASGGQFLLKLGALKLGRVSSNNVVSHVLSIIVTPELLAGLVLYGLSAVVYILVLTRVKLSVAGPAVALGYVFSVLMGIFVFQEVVSPRHWAGLAFIIFGVILVLKR